MGQGFETLAEADMKKKSLIERLEELREEIDAELDRLAEERRPKGIGAVPAGALRQIWLAKGGGNVWDAYAYLAAKELGER
jgi:hypothetical protein